MKKQIIAKLNDLANELDNQGLYQEANELTSVMQRLSAVTDGDNKTLTFYEALEQYLSDPDTAEARAEHILKKMVMPGDVRSRGANIDRYGVVCNDMAGGTFANVIIYEDENGMPFGKSPSLRSRSTTQDGVRALRSAESRVRKFLLRMRGLVERPFDPDSDAAYDLSKGN